MQFCITGDCLGKGQYWIPDFVAVIEKTKNITKEKYLETIIIDSKLSKSTDWTKNQKKAIEMDGWEIKYTNDEPIIGKQIYNFERGSNVMKDGTFIKLFKENESIKTTR